MCEFECGVAFDQWVPNVRVPSGFLTIKFVWWLCGLQVAVMARLPYNMLLCHWLFLYVSCEDQRLEVQHREKFPMGKGWLSRSFLRFSHTQEGMLYIQSGPCARAPVIALVRVDFHVPVRSVLFEKKWVGR
jgi:hypothetical protein